jgi:hypothetical protein
MLDAPPINQKVYAAVMAYGDTLLAKLPTISFEQRTQLQAARNRYDVLIGIIEDNEAVGVSPDVKEADRMRFGSYIHKLDGHPVAYFEEQLEMVQELTGIPKNLCEVFLFEEVIEECACGLIGRDLRADMTNHEVKQAVKESCKLIDEFQGEYISS